MKEAKKKALAEWKLQKKKEKILEDMTDEY